MGFGNVFFRLTLALDNLSRSWDKENGVRMFETGALQVDAEGAGWISGEGLMELVKRKKTDVERDVVNECLRIWG